MERLSRHQCLIYDGSPARHLPGLAAIIKAELASHKRCLYFNAPPMVAGLRSYLAAAGVDVAQEVGKGALMFSFEQEHLVNGRFDAQKMLEALTQAVEQAREDGYRGAWASGDMTWEFGPERDFEKLLEYEYRLEDLFRRHPGLYGICQYHEDSLPSDVVRRGLYAHETLYINETLSRINPYHSDPRLLSRVPPGEADILVKDWLNRLQQPVA
jgi:hypothetical protein